MNALIKLLQYSTITLLYKCTICIAGHSSITDEVFVNNGVPVTANGGSQDMLNDLFMSTAK